MSTSTTVINSKYEEFKTWEPGMKFDVVVGNPPYQNGPNSKFYQEFVEKSKVISTVSAMVIPSAYFTNLENFKHISVYAAKGYFFRGVGIDVCFYVFDSSSKATKLIDLNGSELLVSEVRCPFGHSLDDFKIASKLIVTDGYVSDTGTLYDKTSDRDKLAQLCDTGIKCIFTVGGDNEDFNWATVNPSQSNRIGGLGKHKAVLSFIRGDTSLGYVKYAGPEWGCSAKTVFIEFDSRVEAMNFIKYVQSPIIKCIIRVMKGGSSNNSRKIFKAIPKIDLSKSWSDSELYSYFDLTDTEIRHLEEKAGYEV